MLERPDVPDEALCCCLREYYGLYDTRIAFLPLGNDVNTAVYRVDADAAPPYFLKLRGGPFDEAAVATPHFLHEHGIAQILAPIATTAGHLMTRVGGFAVILFPFVAGQNGFDAPMSARQWVDLGAALCSMHRTTLPPSLSGLIPHERYSSHWRDIVRTFQASVEATVFADPIAAQLAAFLRTRRDEISHIVARAEALAATLRDQSPAHVLCHADIHGGNVLLGTDGTVSIVDWDTLIYAPKERDLMFVGGGIGGVWNRDEEAAWFYEGYGQTAIDPVALAYYRYERIVEDIAAFGEQLLLTEEGGSDRPAALRFFADQFQPNEVVEIAYRTDQALFEQSGNTSER